VVVLRVKSSVQKYRHPGRHPGFETTFTVTARYATVKSFSCLAQRDGAGFTVPGAWREENLEGKATLRAIIADGRWSQFRKHYLDVRSRKSKETFYARAAKAVHEGRLSAIDAPTAPATASAA
jgi:hypothetical protein